mmetsp:Transcript_42155/g.73293  ORF Transcript_42155/g.73293 Transcript_42155/m.73293 type:complete len:80 (-) Transcript_42155:122-361(-)|eukprot:CAMPEP_0184987612 /NCGR_PEP_ID=MMETSP1098-20130426/21176_1 /TAXON_ID=89044 /ORGANISM="Spumella elongata, Strain CCAP 955/1" /LENGTH=79 /DNA_ID=CAMNT_0027512175 /DNA_START=29 /DNA_END=268 /DNA_ORIENTATION=+
MTKTVSFKVGMTCGGCKGAVTRILTKIEGVTEVKADVDTKLVDVVCEDTVDGEVLHNVLKNWGEKAGKSVELLVDVPAV